MIAWLAPYRQRHYRVSAPDTGERRDVRPLRGTSRQGPFQFNLPHRSLEIENHMPNRLPPPWSSEEHSGYFVVRDNNGEAIAYIYYQNYPVRQSPAKLLSKDEARRISVNIAKLPELLSK